MQDAKLAELSEIEKKYLTDRINGLETNRTKSLHLYRDINEFKTETLQRGSLGI
jgi:hypothetical protein